MIEFPFMSWNDMFALMDHHRLTDEQSCLVFNVTLSKLNMAKQLRSVGTFAPTYPFDYTVYQELMVEAIAYADKQLTTQQTVVQLPSTTKELPLTATRKVKVKVPKKRGRQSNRIVTALFAVPNEPTPIEQFAIQQEVSIAVLRQSTRFMEHLSPEDVQKIGKIQIKKVKPHNQLMIWREDLP
jgi:glycine cleavage system protein P-like pyridoxal-binding family